MNWPCRPGQRMQFHAIPGSLLQIILPNSLNDDRGYHEPPSDHAGKRLV